MRRTIFITGRILFHPLLWVVLCFYVLVYKDIYGLHTCAISDRKQLYFSFIMNVYFFPMLLLALCLGLKFVKSIDMRVAEDRIAPILGTMIFLFWAWRVAKEQACVHTAIVKFLFGLFLSTALISVANYFIFFSTFFVGLASMIFLCVSLGIVAHSIPTALCLIVGAAGIVQFLLVKKIHSKAEMAMGCIIGFLSQAAAFVFS